MAVNDVQVGGKDSRIGLAPVKLNENVQYVAKPKLRHT